MYIRRQLENKVLVASKYYPIVMVCGQRQVGKSTMLYNIREPERNYVTLDDINARRIAEEDPALFFDTYKAPLIIDEFQRVPSLLLELKRIVDEKALNNHNVNGLYWLTGSQKFNMMQNVSESLAGRVAVCEMSGFTHNEIVGNEDDSFNPDLTVLKQKAFAEQRDVHEVFEDIFKGGMPKVIASEVNRSDYYMDYVNTYLERDVHDLCQVGKLSEFRQFLVYMAANTAQELKYDVISKEIGVSSPTVKTWVSILERSGLIYILHPYFSKVTDRLIKTPKFYFMDTGLAAYLTRWPDAETLENGNAAGAFFETYVVTEIVKTFYNARKEPDLYYYRDKDQKEIDLISVTENSIYPIEIKKGKNPTHINKYSRILEKFGLEVKPTLILCMSDTLVPYSRDVWYCPIDLI